MKHLALETFPRTLSVELEMPDELPPVFGNATEIHQILLNLCINARDAMPDGGVLSLRAQTAELSVEQVRDHPKAKPGPAVVVCVSDSGRGIAPEVMERMYEPFFSTKAPSQGSGLGLSTVLGIVRSHEGVIECTSAPGRGTEFRVYLAVAPASAMPPLGTATKALRTGRGEVILVVDDEAAVRTIVAASLQNNGYQVVTASDGRQALGRLAAGGGKFAAIFTDIAMPQMDGVQLIAEVRRLYPHLAVAAMTGMITDEKRAELAGLGVVKILRKPFVLTEVLEAVRTALARG
jgi:CheY-like chemotaxis protein